MRFVTVKGNRFEVVSLREGDLRPGAVVRWKESRKALRIVCFDGDDAILRNMRRPDLLEVAPRESVLEECWLLVPAQ